MISLKKFVGRILAAVGLVLSVGSISTQALIFMVAPTHVTKGRDGRVVAVSFDSTCTVKVSSDAYTLKKISRWLRRPVVKVTSRCKGDPETEKNLIYKELVRLRHWGFRCALKNSNEGCILHPTITVECSKEDYDLLTYQLAFDKSIPKLHRSAIKLLLEKCRKLVDTGFLDYEDRKEITKMLFKLDGRPFSEKWYRTSGDTSCYWWW